MNVLVTNDDGIDAPGLAALAEAARAFGQVWVVAPRHEQSGVGHGVTLSRPLRLSRVEREGRLFGHAVSGTPADCVKVAVTASLVPRPGLVLSGVNFGRNAGIHLFYSGTVAAAIEAAMLGVPSAAVSVDFADSPDFTTAAQVACEVIGPMVRRWADGGEAPQALNVNVPALPRGSIRGVRLAAQCSRAFVEVMERRGSEDGSEACWLSDVGWPVGMEEDSDVALVREGYVTVTPLRFDMTDWEWMRRISPADLCGLRGDRAEG